MYAAMEMMAPADNDRDEFEDERVQVSSPKSQKDRARRKKSKRRPKVEPKHDEERQPPLQPASPRSPRQGASGSGGASGSAADDPRMVSYSSEQTSEMQSDRMLSRNSSAASIASPLKRHPSIENLSTPAREAIMRARENSDGVKRFQGVARAVLAGVREQNRIDRNRNRDLKSTYKKIDRLDQLMMRANNVVTLCALIGVVLMIIENEYLYNRDDEWDDVTESLKAAITVTTLIAQVGLHRYYVLLIEQLKLKNILLPEETLWSSSFVNWYLLEVFVMALHTPPYIQQSFSFRGIYDETVTYTLDVIGGLLMLLRVYLVVRALRMHSPLNARSAQLVGTLNNVNLDGSFTLKTILHKNPYIFLLSLLIVNMLVTAYATHMCERVVNEQHEDYLNSLWFLFATITTIGWGDVFANTYCGRGFAMIGAISGVVTTALLISIVNQTVQLSRAQVRVVNLLAKERWTREMKEVAVRAVQALWKWKRNRKNFLYRFRAGKALQRWRYTRREYNAFMDRSDQGQTIQPVLQQMATDIHELLGTVQGIQDQVHSLEKRVFELDARIKQRGEGSSSRRGSKSRF